jgi:hypothetical protein
MRARQRSTSTRVRRGAAAGALAGTDALGPALAGFLPGWPPPGAR